MLCELSYCIALQPVSSLLQSEMVDEEDVRRLAATIEKAGKWTTPISVEKRTGIVMDGNHRLKAAALLGLRFLPCVPLDYLDPRVSVSHWDTGAPFCVNSIGRRVLQDRLPFPYKTTRHSFAPTLPQTDIPLLLLRKSSSMDARGNRSAPYGL
jgi:hypothetical protein